MHGARLLYNGDSDLVFEQKKTLSCALVIKDRYYYRHCHSHDFCLQTKLSTSGIVVLCSDQKFINVSHKKIDIEIQIVILLFKIRSKIKKSGIVTTLKM